ncbi:MAG: PEP-CTERM sorting domain-containing protein [Gammaproteobacteria bacterium]|nr:PEP-CTERM sorting domain-containing protein [Gammaproteobacteria bacterium]
MNYQKNNKLFKSKILGFASLLILMLSSPINAAPLFVHSHGDHNEFYFGGSNSQSSNYNAGTQTYTASIWGGESSYTEVGGGLFAFDITGELNLTAQINNDGNLISGSISWIGESVSLGILPGSTLMEGTLTDAYYVLPHNPGDIAEVGNLGMQFIIDVTSLNSSFAETDKLALMLFHEPDPYSLSNVFAHDFTGHAYTSADMYYLPSPVPEPLTSTLLGIGLLGMGFIRRRNKFK